MLIKYLETWEHFQIVYEKESNGSHAIAWAVITTTIH